MDPSLETRPVPRTRQFSIRSFGPGSDPNIHQTAISYRDLDAITGYQPVQRPRAVPPPMMFPTGSFFTGLEQYQELRLREKMRAFLQSAEDIGQMDWRNVASVDPTWGFFVFVTSYTETALHNLDAALSTLVQAVRREFLRETDIHSEPYALEAFKRFKLDVILSKDALEDASDDRVREEFNAHVRHLHFWSLNEEEPAPDPSNINLANPRGLNRPPGPGPRFTHCIALDEAKIVELSAIEFPERVDEDKEAIQGVKVKMIRRYWDYPAVPIGNYGAWVDGVRIWSTGADWCPIWKIQMIYAESHPDMNLDQLTPMVLHHYFDVFV